MRIELADPALLAFCCVAAGAFGAVFASFINCAAWRIARGESFITGRSHCASCGHPLSAGDLVPIFSYLALRGKCRYCGEKVSPRYMLTELFLAAAFVCLVLRFGASGEALRYMGLAVILLGLSLVDLETFRIPDGFILAGIIWWAVTIPLVWGEGREGQLLLRTGTDPVSGLIGGFGIGILMLLMVLLFDRISGKETMGGGDIKLFFMTGLYLGPAVGFFNLILSCVIGLLFVAVTRKKKIPFGPSISLAAFVSLFVGRAVISWYIGLF